MTSKAAQDSFINRLINNKLTDDDKSFVQVAMQKRRNPTRDQLLKFPEFVPNYLHQADLLFLPEDRKNRYVLTVVDSGSKLIGLEPIKNKEAETVVAALKKIYKRVQGLNIPTRMNTDDGTEFKGAFSRLMTQLKINHKRGIPDRHASTKLVEYMQGFVSRIIFNLQHRAEMQSGWKNYNTKFVQALRTIEKEYNIKMRKRKAKQIVPGKYNIKDKDIYDIGTPVYKYLDAPRDNVAGKKLDQRFRATDLRLEPFIRYIKDYHILPDQKAVAYQLSGFPKTRIFPAYSFELASKVKK